MLQISLTYTKTFVFVDGLDTSDMTDVLMYCSFFTERFRIKAVLDRANKWATDLENKPHTTVRSITSSLAELSFITAKVSALPCNHQENTADIMAFIKRCSAIEHSLRYKIVGELSGEVESQLSFILNGDGSS